MTRRIRKIGIIGAGTMGTGIAAQAANAGLEVVLLDKFPGKAEEGIRRMLNAKPTDAFNAGFMHPAAARRIETGTTDDDLEKLTGCDWIIESILAPQPARRALYTAIQKVAKKDAVFSSNTSTMQTGFITDGQDDDFKRRFLNTHFFNPVRFMHLLEIIPGRDTDPEAVAAVTACGDRDLGKKTVLCRDERGFIANRIGIYAMERAKSEAMHRRTNIEDADAALGRAFGFPPLGMFRLADEVGLDVVDHVREDLREHLLPDDDFQTIYTGADVRKMLESGYYGNRKPDSKGGYYRTVKDLSGKALRQALDLAEGDYRDLRPSPWRGIEKRTGTPGGLRKFLDSAHPAAKFSWPVLRDIMLYTLTHAQDLAHDIQAVDDAMRAGYNWEYGPFQLLDRMGVAWFREKLRRENITPPPLLGKVSGSFYKTDDGALQVMGFDGRYAPVRREEGVLYLEDVKRRSRPLVTHNSASLWDIGDGVTCLEFHSRQNTIDPSVLWVVNESIRLVGDSGGKYKAMVVYNDAPRFSAGANLKLAEIFMNAADHPLARMTGLSGMAENGLKNLMHEMVYQGQAVYTALNQAPFPVIGAPKGQPRNMAFGGGCEILLNCDAIQAGPEQVMALPETALGLVPAWTGATRYLARCRDAAKSGIKGPMTAVMKAAAALANPLASASTSSQDARDKLWLRPGDGITMNPDRVLADAKARALSMAPGYKPQPLPAFTLPGAPGKAAIRMNVDSLYLRGGDPKKGGINHIDVQAIDRLADILTGGDKLNEQDIPAHAGAQTARLTALAAEKPDRALPVSPALTINWNSMMQRERERIMDAFADRAHVWPRIKTTLATNAPPREPRPDPAPSPHDLRAAMEPHELPRRNIDGAPLTGRDANILKTMADMTAALYRQDAARTVYTKLRQLPKTLLSIGRVMREV